MEFRKKKLSSVYALDCLTFDPLLQGVGVQSGHVDIHVGNDGRNAAAAAARSLPPPSSPPPPEPAPDFLADVIGHIAESLADVLEEISRPRDDRFGPAADAIQDAPGAVQHVPQGAELAV